jgi:hypothetical protein
MGGTMGPMPGQMLPLLDGIILVKILLSITCSISVLFMVLFLIGKDKEDEKITLSWILRPILLFSILLLLFVGIDYIITHPLEEEPEIHKMHHHSFLHVLLL